MRLGIKLRDLPADFPDTIYSPPGTILVACPRCDELMTTPDSDFARCLGCDATFRTRPVPPPTLRLPSR